MTEESLTYMDQCMEALEIPYEFGEWTSGIRFPYWVGEYIESQPQDEDGKEESTFILTGTTDGTWTGLEKTKKKIKSYFGMSGRTEILPEGAGIFVSFENSTKIPSENQGIKRMQINLSVKEWREES